MKCVWSAKQRDGKQVSDLAKAKSSAWLQSTGAQGTESPEQGQHENAKENAIPGPKTSLLRPTRATM